MADTDALIAVKDLTLAYGSYMDQQHLDFTINRGEIFIIMGAVAAEMREVVQIISIAEELKSEFDAVAPFCDELIQIVDDFDFDGIQKIVLELDS
jgi:ABC-type transporter Mla maintaining outer membrane lipid asymmetry ATPase subunit MlaF